VKILFCVQRYGDDVVGGAEAACRGFAEGMAGRGHQVHVLTSAARDYTSWADHYPLGESRSRGVVIHRLPVRAPRTEEQFGVLSARALGRDAPLGVQRDWLRVQGPDLAEQRAWLTANAHRFDVAVFYTYLYPTSGLGLTTAAPFVPTVLHPAAHAEPTYDLAVFDEVFARADGIAVHTPEEADLVTSRRPYVSNVAVIGSGVEEPQLHGDGARFRERFGIGSGALASFVGRIDRNKGTDELVRYFGEFRRRVDGDAWLALVGQQIHDMGDLPGIVSTGYVDEQTKTDAYAATSVFILPSYLESFSIALCEAWLVRRPALVQGACDVLAGQVDRSGGGIAYRSYAEFEQSLAVLFGDPRLRDRLGERGRAYVLDRYPWPRVLARYEAFLGGVIDGRASGRCGAGSPLPEAGQ
jgi:glycosyltransferase involved in cell wall biosynthesis